MKTMTITNKMFSKQILQKGKNFEQLINCKLQIKLIDITLNQKYPRNSTCRVAPQFINLFDPPFKSDILHKKMSITPTYNK